MNQSEDEDRESQIQNRLRINQLNIVYSYLQISEIQSLKLVSKWFYVQTIEYYKIKHFEILQQIISIEESVQEIEEVIRIQSQDLNEVKKIFQLTKINCNRLVSISNFDLVEMKTIVYPTIYVSQVCHILLAILQDLNPNNETNNWCTFKQMLGKSDFIGSLLLLNPNNMSDQQIYTASQAVEFNNLTHNHSISQILIDYVKGLYAISQFPLTQRKRQLNQIKKEKSQLSIQLKELERMQQIK